MTRTLRFMAFLLLLTSCSGDRDGTPASGSTPSGASIEGFVREISTDRPIAGANVFIVRPPDQPQFRTTSDGDGRFVLPGVDGGTHLVGYSKEGYVAPGRLERTGSTIRVSPDERVENIILPLIAAGSLSGRVLKADGEPARRIEIQLLQSLYLMGQPQWTVVVPPGVRSRTETNERGEFRVVGVDPGEYVIRLNPREATIESITPGGKPLGPTLY